MEKNSAWWEIFGFLNDMIGIVHNWRTEKGTEKIAHLDLYLTSYIDKLNIWPNEQIVSYQDILLLQ